MKTYHWLIMIAILSFAVFQWYSVQSLEINRQRLDNIKDVYFPVLENIDQNIVRLDQVKELFLQSVMTAESDLVNDANKIVVKAQASLTELKTSYPTADVEIDHLKALFLRYSELSTEISMGIIESVGDVTPSQKVATKLAEQLASLKEAFQHFRDDSYEKFLGTLSETQLSAENGLRFGVAIGLMNLFFLGILGFLMTSNSRMMSVIEDHNTNLEERVSLRTRELERAQKELVKSEKMASLGGLVSGVAHEINTPIGVCITAASHLEEEARSFAKKVESGAVKKSQLIKLLEGFKEGNHLIQANLQRAAELIRNFKRVAVDQSVEDMRQINMGQYLEDLLTSLRPKWKHTKVDVITDFAPHVGIKTYPGAVAQIFTNLIANSLKHGFNEGRNAGEIAINLRTLAKPDKNKVQIIFSDTGKGMSDEVGSKIFDPFFTTERGSGGTGLGMHIVYNLVTHKLGGAIQCESRLGEGVKFTITLPEQIQEEA